MDSFVESAARISPMRQTNAADAIVPHRNWIVARDLALDALRRGTKLTAIVGPPGVGKTLLLEDLARTLGASGTDVWLLPPGEVVCGSDDDGVILVDEDCDLNDGIWARMFRSPGCYVIAGPPRLTEYLRTFPYGVETVFIDPIEADEVAPYITAQLLRAGEEPDLFTPAALTRLTVHAGGIPQTLNALARSALGLADTEKALAVRPQHVDAAASEDRDFVADDPHPGPRLSLSSTRSPRRSWRWKAPVAGLACVGTIVGTLVAFTQGGDSVNRPLVPVAASAATPVQPPDPTPGAAEHAPPALASIPPTPVTPPSGPAQPGPGEQAAAPPSAGHVNAAKTDNSGLPPVKRRLSHRTKSHRKAAAPARPSESSSQ